MPETPRPALTRVAVLIPTYNEAENLAGVVERVRSVTPEVDVVVLDDNSPDGTGEIADRLAAADEQVHVLHRPGKAGLGAAYLDGFQLDMGLATDDTYALFDCEEGLDGLRRRGLLTRPHRPCRRRHGRRGRCRWHSRR